IGEGNHAFVEIIHELSLQKSRISLTPSWDFRRYQTAFAQLKENIRIGEIYQTCLSFPFFGEAVESPRALFAQLFQKNPAPMAAYLEQSNRTVLSLSPERFIVWDGHTIETMPIKGTRPRGKTPEQDRAIKEDLLRNEKERAELNMITDLLRNDLAKVCKPGSVKVHELRAIQECPNVWHAYSHIVGESKEGILAWDIVEAMFPGGSISGCPKRRAVEILTELESQARGIYTGCIGMISDHGRMDLNIAIRTLEQSAERIQASFGGGIVYDSVAEREYQEIFDKAKPFLSGPGFIGFLDYHDFRGQ
ncbi:MAG: anthranilate synthase component I family protein, partial [Candidatus Gracilibacteria bacterium]|nr:anthranilate synthase component I family protein [Candidatus Gracilibacteria bacterium]